MIGLRFVSSALPEDTFQVLKFDGEEEISRLFRFELHLVSRDPAIDFKSVLESYAFLAITTRDNTRYLHGMLSTFEPGGEWHNGLYEYRAVLQPRPWVMSQSTPEPDISESDRA
jgi:type VI secretion system secreted protein VgrG